MPTHYPARLLVALILLLLTAAKANALSVAVFPLDDLGAAFNSINQPMTDILRQEAARQGMTVISREQVESFMSAHRIRRLGLLQGQDVTAAGVELQADLVMLASLCQQSETSATLGITVSLLRTSDGKTIWTSTKGASLFAEQRLLGIDAPTSMENLQVILIRELFSTWPAEFETLTRRSPPEDKGLAAVDATDIAVDSVLFTPKYVRPGQEVKCTISFTMPKEASQTKVFIRVGNRIHTAKTEDGVYYQVSWIGEEGKTGTQLQVAMNDPESRIIKGIWSGDSQDASYPVTLILEWPSGKRQESYLGTYVVDSHPPEITLKLQAKTLDGTPAFRIELPITAHLKRREPIEKWAFAVTSPEGKVLLSEKGSEQPPESFRWRGQDAKNQRLEPGFYDLSLKVWDRAGNMGRTSQRVLLLSVKPGLDLTVSQQQEKIVATLSALDQVGISYWRMELWGQDNTMLQAFEGETLPARIEMPAPLNNNSGPTDCVVQVRDALGMKASKKVANLLSQTTGDNATTSGKTTDPAEDDWHADF